jgi:hypothetical protein
MVVFLILFVLNKDCFGLRKNRSSLFMSTSVLFWLFSIGVRFYQFFVFYIFA